MRYGWSIALVASAFAVPASAQERRYPIHVDARDLASALVQLSAQTGISVATDGVPPRGPAPRFQGRMTAEQALARLLDPMGWEAVRVAPRAYRLRARAVPVAAAAPAEPPPPDIVVTGRKRQESASSIPGPVAVYRPDQGGASVMGATTTTREVARSVVGLSVTDAGPGAERLFLRGVADSPFNGFSQSTVSVQLDETRIAFDGADPGLRLVDIARVEVLKGPQGPLYGTGALGGVYRIVTNRPVLDRTEGEMGVGLSGVADGGLGPMVQGVVNLPLIKDLLGLRMVGYGVVDPGWIDDDDGRRDRNRTRTRGGRVALRLAPWDGWLLDASAARQAIDARDTRYVDRPDSYRRDVPIAEPYWGRLYSYQGSLSGPVGNLRMTIASGLTTQTQYPRYYNVRPDITAPIPFFHSRRLRVFDQEIRFASDPGQAVSWVAGASLLLTLTEADLVGLTASGIPIWAGTANRHVSEVALFADGSFPLADRWRLGMGLRAFRAGTHNNRVGTDSAAVSAGVLLGITPNVSLSYSPAADRIFYARIATAYRPGGLDSDDSLTHRYAADEVRTLDLGGRMRFPGGRLGLDGNVFVTRWSNIQSDYLLPQGWIGTRNAGRASVPGTEWSADWQPGRTWRVEGAAIWQRPRRTGLGGASSYLPLVPDISGRLAMSREMTAGAWQWTPRLSADFIGTTHLGLDGPADRRMPPRVVGRLGLVAQSRRLTLTLDIDNLLGVRSDVFALGNPFTMTAVRYYTPHRPRTLSIGATRRF